MGYADYIDELEHTIARHKFMIRNPLWTQGMSRLSISSPSPKQKEVLLNKFNDLFTRKLDLNNPPSSPIKGSSTILKQVPPPKDPPRVLEPALTPKDPPRVLEPALPPTPKRKRTVLKIQPTHPHLVIAPEPIQRQVVKVQSTHRFSFQSICPAPPLPTPCVVPVSVIPALKTPLPYLDPPVLPKPLPSRGAALSLEWIPPPPPLNSLSKPSVLAPPPPLLKPLPLQKQQSQELSLLTEKWLAHQEVIIHTTEQPQVLFITDSLKNALAVREVLQSDAGGDVEGDRFEIRALNKGKHPKEMLLNSSIKVVLVITDNPGYDKPKHLLPLITGFLDTNRIVKIAMPRTSIEGETLAFVDLLEKKKGYSRAARVLRSALEISSSAEFDHPHEPLQTTLQKITEQKILKQEPSRKESTTSRIRSAVETYLTAEPLTPGCIITVNLWLRGITEPLPSMFRAAVLKHPDLPDSENDKILHSKDGRTPLLQSIQERPSLKEEIIAYKQEYWVVKEDVREKKFTQLRISNFKSSLTITVTSSKISVNGIPLPEGDTSLQVCSFRQYARLIPYYSTEGALIGIERTFFSAQGGKLSASYPEFKHLRNKLARGLTSGASVSFYEGAIPEWEIRGEGSENVLSVLEALKKQESLARQMGIPLDKGSWNCRITSCVGVNDLIKMPLDSRTKTIFIIADNDGYNAETHQTLIDTISHLLEKGFVVKVALPLAPIPGQKIDLNDILIKQGVTATGEVLKNSVEIRDIRDIEPPDVLFQLQFRILYLKQQLEKASVQTLPIGNGEEKALLLLELGDCYFQLKKYSQALECYNTSRGALELPLKPPTRARILHSLGCVHLAQHHTEASIDYLEESLEEKIHHYGSLFHKDVASTLCQMGRAYMEQKNYKIAKTYFIQSLDILEYCFPKKTDVLAAEVHHALGLLYVKQGQYDSALDSFFRDALIRKKTGSHTNTLELAETLKKIGDVYYKQRKFLMAIEHYLNALGIQQSLFCSSRYGVDEDLLLKIAKAYFLCKRYKSALEYYCKSFSTYKNTAHPRMLKLLLRRANALSQQLIHVDEATHKPELVVSPPLATNPLSRVESLHQIGDEAYAQRKFPMAIDNYLNALRIQKRLLITPQSPHDTDKKSIEETRKDLEAELLLKIAKAYFLSGRYANAVEYYFKNFHVHKETFQSPILQKVLRRAEILAKPPSLQTRINPITTHPVDLSVNVPYSLQSSSFRQHFAQWAYNPQKRQVALDLEMTGNGILHGGKITEIGCVELINLNLTGNTFQAYVNPETPVRRRAYEITGLCWSFLSHFPTFKNTCAEFLAFIADAELIIHDARSDIQFLEHELALMKSDYRFRERHRIIDTLELSRVMHPLGHSLDALCSRYSIDSEGRNTRASKHGALKDAQLLAEVYIAMFNGEISFDPEKTPNTIHKL